GAACKQRGAEATEPGLPRREAIRGPVQAEGAGAAGSRREEDVVVENLLARNAFLLEELEILHQVAHSEIGGIALAVVAEFLARLEASDIRHRQFLALVSAALEDGADQVFVLPGKTTKQDGDVATLLRRECPLDGAMEVRGLIQPREFAQADSFRFQTLLNFVIQLDVYQLRRHAIPPP